MLHLDGAGGDSEADVLMMLRRLIGGQVKGTLGWGVGVAVPAAPTLGGCPRGLEVWWLRLLLLGLLRSLGGLGLGLGLSLGLGLGLRHRRRRRRRLHLLLEIRRVVFAHVFHQVRFRRVGPAADGAGVHLGVLHGVRGQVHLQRGRVCVCPMTVVALEGFIFVVLPPVGLQIGELREGLLTARVCTFVRSVTGVDSARDEKRRKGRTSARPLGDRRLNRPPLGAHGGLQEAPAQRL